VVVDVIREGLLEGLAVFVGVFGVEDAGAVVIVERVAVADVRVKARAIHDWGKGRWAKR
jgi:hypothetical protein